MVIEKETFQKIIENPKSIKRKEISLLKRFLDKYSFFNLGQLLLLSGYINIDSTEYNDHLKKTAIYVYDREKLFTYINALEREKHVNKKDNEKNERLKFTEKEKYSFSEWLKLSKTNKKKNKTSIIKIDSLIKDLNNKQKNNLNPKNQIFKEDRDDKSLNKNNEIITPTLAKVYFHQGHYDLAISAYKKLCLKYPEKNSFFANQIKIITKIQNK